LSFSNQTLIYHGVKCNELSVFMLRDALLMNSDEVADNIWLRKGSIRCLIPSLRKLQKKAWNL
jgi:hypothetical protein